MGIEKITAGDSKVGDQFTIETADTLHQARVVKVEPGSVYYAPPAPGETYRFMMPDESIAGDAGSPLHHDVIPEGGIPVAGIAPQRNVTKM